MIIEFLIAFALGWWIGHKVSGFWMALSFREILKDLGVTEQQLKKLAEKNGIDLPEKPTEESEETPILTPIEIRIEEHQGVLYAYRLDNDQFLGQGTDREALIERLTDNLTNVRLIVAEEHGAGLITQK
jgi:PP-loop superfamily ATP-utilizing enzyme